MRLGKEIVEKIKREVGENQKKIFMPFQSIWEDKAIHCQIDIEDGDRLALQITKLWISFKAKNVLNKDLFESLLNQMKETATYLPDNFRVVEIDKTNFQALLCSEKPVKNNEVTEYFQLKINTSLEFNLQRVRNINHKNEVIPFVISYGILERFIQDCVGIVNRMFTEG